MNGIRNGVDPEDGADHPDARENGAKGTILLVDDTPDNLDVLGELLQPRYRVRAATSGAAALAIAAREPQPDLILLDVMMPQMDGYEVLSRLRGAPATRDIPVIFVTALGESEDEVRGLELGAVDYISKPYMPATVLARVDAHMTLKRARDHLRDEKAYLEAEVARRINEHQKAQEQLLQSEKLASLGQLVAGIAHELNNPISFVHSNLGTLEGYLGDVLQLLDAYVQLEANCGNPDAARAAIAALKKRMDFDFVRSDIEQLVADSIEGLKRVRTIVQDLKEHAHTDDTAWAWADLHRGLRAILHIIWNELKYKCQVREEFGELPLVWCIPSQLDQVFMNLLVNAAHAIPEKGEILIATSRHSDEVWVEISDTGTGIDPENLNHIFEPFFTTKPVGKGTGLGLSLSHSIVRRHQGRIEVESTLGKGSTFRVVLPIRPQDEGIPVPPEDDAPA